MVEDDEDTSKLRQCFYGYILDNSRDILLLMNKNLHFFVANYGNDHTIKTFKGRTQYVEPSNSDSGSNKDNTPKSKPTRATNNLDFSSAVEGMNDGLKSKKN